MMYFIGRVVISEHETGREYFRDACICAADEKQAMKELDIWAGDWGGDNVVKAHSGYMYNRDDQAYTVAPHQVQEVPYAGFHALSKINPVFGVVSKGDLTEQTAPEQTKTLAHRLQRQLGKVEVKAPYGKLVTALAASLGETDWQSLKHKGAPAAQAQAPQIEEEWFPSGSFVGELRDAKAIPFEVRMHSVWLAEGDVKIAARLLRVAPSSLMGSFEHAMEADSAFCGRPFEWVPEDSMVAIASQNQSN